MTPVSAQDEKGGTQPDTGVKFDSYPHPFSRGALAYSLADRWDKTDLTFHFNNCPSTIDCNTGYEAVRAGFQEWANISILRFTEVTSARQADIELGWSSEGPELGRTGDVLAFAYFPSDGGDVFFDDREPWTTFDGSEFDLFLVATHEIGHALGLDHSSVPSALMYPVLTGQTYGLSPDDAAAIQALYGANEDQQNESRPIPQQPDLDAEQESGEITNAYPYETWEFEAFAGETVIVTMAATSGDLVPYVGILTADEKQVLAEGGARGSSTVQVVYTFNQDGSYVIIATREGVEEGFTTGTYTLRLEFDDAISQADPSGSMLLTIRSYSSIDICELYLSPSSDDTWGSSLINVPLTNGNYIDLEVDADVYDVLAVGCDGTEIEEYEIEVVQDLEVEIYEYEINIYTYNS